MQHVDIYVYMNVNFKFSDLTVAEIHPTNQLFILTTIGLPNQSFHQPTNSFPKYPIVYPSNHL